MEKNRNFQDKKKKLKAKVYILSDPSTSDLFSSSESKSEERSLYSSSNSSYYSNSSSSAKSKTSESTVTETYSPNISTNESSEISQPTYSSYEISSFCSKFSSVSGSPLRNLDECLSNFSKIKEKQTKYFMQLKQQKKENELLAAKLQETTENLQNANKEIEKMRSILKSKNKLYVEHDQENVQKMREKYESDIRNLKEEIARKNTLIFSNKNTPSPLSSSQKSTDIKLYESKIALLQEQLTKATREAEAEKTENESLQLKYDQLQNEYDKNQREFNLTMHKCKKQIKQLTKKNECYEDTVQTLRATITNLETVNKQISDRNEQLLSSQRELNVMKQQKQEATCSIKFIEKENKAKDDEIAKLKTANSGLVENIQSCDSLLEEQRKEIADAYQNRTDLVALVHKMRSAMESAERIINQIQDENEKLKQEKVERENQNQSLHENSQINELYDHIIKSVPYDLANDIRKLSPLPVDEQIQQIVDILISHIGQKKSSSSVSDNEDYDILKTQYTNLYDFLANTLSFVRKICHTNEVDPKVIIRQQCARISLFLEQNKPTFNKKKGLLELPMPHESPFESTNIKEITRIVEDFIGSEQSKESPYAEIVLLLSSMATANAMLMENAEINRTRVIELANNAQINKDNMEKAKEAHYLKKREHKLKKLLSEYTKDDPIEWIQNNIDNIFKDNDDLKKKIRKLESDIDELQNTAAEKAERDALYKREFCNKAQSIVMIIQNEFRAAQKELMDKIKASQKELKNAQKQNKEIIKKLRNEHIEEKTKMQDEQDYFVGYSQKLDKQVEDLQNQLSNMKEELKTSKETFETEKENYDKEKAEYEERIMELEKINNKLSKKHEQAKNRLSHVNETIEQITKGIAERSAKENKAQSDKIEKLQEELYTAKNDLEIAQKRSDQAIENNISLQEQVAKLQISERTIKFKYDSLLEQIEREREANRAKNTTITSVVEGKYKELLNAKEKELDTAKSFLSQIAQTHKTTATDELISLAQNAMTNKDATQKAANENVQVRKEFNIPNSETLSSAFRRVSNALVESQKKATTAESNARKATENLSKMQREMKRSCNSTAELKEWVNWARMMYMNVTNDAAPMYSSADLRYLLQESLLNGIGVGSLTRKVEILRAEKTVLKSPVYRLSTPYNRKPTARTALAIVVFAHRLLALRGIMPARYAHLPSQTLNDNDDYYYSSEEM